MQRGADDRTSCSFRAGTSEKGKQATRGVETAIVGHPFLVHSLIERAMAGRRHVPPRARGDATGSLLRL